MLRTGARRVGQRRRTRAGIARLDRMEPARRAHPRRIAEEARDRGPVESRRHDEQPQLGCEMLARIETECEPQVGLEAALVELVEDEGGDALERRVALQQPGQHPFGDDLDARRARDARVEAHAVAHRAPDALAEALRHALRAGARGEAPGFQHDEPLTRRPVLPEQGEGNHRALAGTGRRLEHGSSPRAERRGERLERLIDRQAGLHQIRTRASAGR